MNRLWVAARRRPGASITRASLGLAIALAAGLVQRATVPARAAGPPAGRYSAWKYDPDHDYFFARFTRDSQQPDRYDYCIYQPAVTGRCYYYDPAQKAYIGLYSYNSGKFYPLDPKTRKWQRAEAIPFATPPRPPTATQAAALRRAAGSPRPKPPADRPGGRSQRYETSVVDDRFDPATTTIRAGDTMVWTNRGRRVHTITSDTGGFDSRDLLPGQSFEHQFSEAGEFPYHDALARDMTGIITVTKR